MISAYRRDGFVKVRGLLSRDEALRYREAALAAAGRAAGPAQQAAFDQHVNVWTHDEVLRELSLLPRLAAAAEALAGVPLRLWHDHVLIKRVERNTPTQFHQDQPYWPHIDAGRALSAWIALGDVPPERGCMTFIAGSHAHTDLPPQDLDDRDSLFRLCPELRWEPRVAVPLEAGDCTFHHCRTAHQATANITEEPRVGFVVAFMDAHARFSGGRHPVTLPLGLERGAALDGPRFPQAGAAHAARRRTP